MNLFEKYETDAAKETAGVAVVVDGCTFYTRRAGGSNRAYRYALGLAARQLSSVFNAEPRDEHAVFEASEEIQMRAWAQTCAVGWDNVDGRDGLPLEFTKDAALDLVRSCPAVWDEIKAVAVDDARFKPDTEDGALLGKS